MLKSIKYEFIFEFHSTSTVSSPFPKVFSLLLFGFLIVSGRVILGPLIRIALDKCSIDRPGTKITIPVS